MGYIKGIYDDNAGSSVHPCETPISTDETTYQSATVMAMVIILNIYLFLYSDDTEYKSQVMFKNIFKHQFNSVLSGTFLF